MIESIPSLIGFLKHFHRRWLDDPSLDPRRIPPALPEVLATIYRELGALIENRGGAENGWRAPFSTQDVLLPPGQLEWIDGMVEFAWENQGNWSARCPVSGIDPPVYSNWVEYWEPPQQGHQRVCDALSHFLTGHCLQEAVMSCQNLIAVDESDPAGAVKIALEPLWLGGHHLGDEPAGDFYFSPEWEVLVMRGDGNAWVGAPEHPLRGLVAPDKKFQVLAGD